MQQSTKKQSFPARFQHHNVEKLSVNLCFNFDLFYFISVTFHFMNFSCFNWAIGKQPLYILHCKETETTDDNNRNHWTMHVYVIANTLLQCSYSMSSDYDSQHHTKCVMKHQSLLSAIRLIVHNANIRSQYKLKTRLEIFTPFFMTACVNILHSVHTLQSSLFIF